MNPSIRVEAQRYIKGFEPDLYSRLVELRPQLAAAAQVVYDQWTGDGEEPTYGSGGICDDVANALGNVIVVSLPGVHATDGGAEGDDHAYLLVYEEDDPTAEVFVVDIHPSRYERGGGYCWTKIAGVRFTPDDIYIGRAGLTAADLQG